MKRILIICAGLQFGGVERFVTNIIKYALEGEFSFDYLIFDGLGDAFAPEIEAKGGRIISIPSPNKGYKAYIDRLGSLIDENRYEVIHSHTQFNSGINMWVAKKHGVPVRIAHSHTTAHENRVSLKQTVYENIMRVLAKKYSTHLCACGEDAGRWMFGNHAFTVINNGIDTQSFKFSEENRRRIREERGISENAFVIGHSGTLLKLKNQELLIRLMPEILKQRENAILMLLGRGPKDFEDHLHKVAEDCSVADKVLLVGAVLNPNEYLSAFDVFAFPSLREGTPLALIEAQANGLPCIISDTVPQDACVSDLVKALHFDNGLWISSLLRSERHDPEEYAKRIAKAGFDIHSAMQPLFDIYRCEV